MIATWLALPVDTPWTGARIFPTAQAAPLACPESFATLARTGAPESREAVLQRIEKLYPHLTRAEIEGKIGAATDSFLFFRSFVPLRFQALKDSPQWKNELAPLLGADHQGWAMGDIHPDNFGFILLNDGRVIFNMNDFDDNAKAPLVTDVISMLAALRTYDRTAPPAELLAAYRNGLGDSPMEMPAVLKKLRDKAIKDGRRPKDSAFESFLGMADKDKLKRVEGSRNLTDTEQAAITAAIEKIYGASDGVKIKDAFHMKRDGGGSGDLERFRVLVKFDSETGIDSKRQIIELKRLVNPGLEPVASGPIPSASQRIAQSLRLAFGTDASRLYAVDSVLDMDMFFRPRWDGNIGITIAEFGKTDQKSILAYEAWTLGQLHRRSADKMQAYTDALGRVPDSALIDAADFVTGELDTAYKLLKN